MKCPRCAAAVTRQDKYCPSCGLALEAAQKTGGAKKPVIKEYEEASTQLVDVDEFRKYMAREGEEPEPAEVPKPAPNLAVAEASSRVTSLASPDNPGAATEGAHSSGAGSERLTPASAAASGKPVTQGTQPKSAASGLDDNFPELRHTMGQRVILVGMEIVAVLLVVLLIYKLVT